MDYRNEYEDCIILFQSTKKFLKKCKMMVIYFLDHILLGYPLEETNIYHQERNQGIKTPYQEWTGNCGMKCPMNESAYYAKNSTFVGQHANTETYPSEERILNTSTSTIAKLHANSTENNMTGSEIKTAKPVQLEHVVFVPRVDTVFTV